MKNILTFFENVKLTTNQLVLLTCSYIVLVLNLPFLTRALKAVVALEDYNVFFLLSLPIFLLSLSVIIQGFLSFRWITKPLLIFAVVSSALMFYATINYGVVFDYGMVQNTIETDTAEALSYVNFSAISFFVIFAVFPSWVIYSVRIVYKPFLFELRTRLKLVSLSALMVFLIAGVFNANYAAVGRNNKHLVNYITPYKMFDATYKYVRNNYFYPPLKFEILDVNPSIVREENTKNVTVLVLGETARSKSFSLNGYDKPTNQYTEKQQVVSFSNMISCGTATAVSVPCMFSRLSKENYNKRSAIAQQNVIDIVHLAGADVLWVSNNNGSCKGVCTRVKNEKVETDKSDPLCDGEYCYDESLLKPLRNKLENITHDNTLIVLHMIGSHGPTYFKRYPEDKRLFSPDCQRSDIQNCTHEELINTYDNTIAYTDYVLSNIIKELDDFSSQDGIEASMLYISDHGESLGEKGVYLHGLPYAFAPDEQTHIPMIYWAGSQQTDFSLSCLAGISDSPVTHDNIFDIVLSVMSVRTKMYNVDNDPFIRCKSRSAIARMSMINKLQIGLIN